MTDEDRLDWLEEHAELKNGKWTIEIEAEDSISYFRLALDAAIEKQAAKENQDWERGTWDGVDEE
jgi:hypothetical protein